MRHQNYLLDLSDLGLTTLDIPEGVTRLDISGNPFENGRLPPLPDSLTELNCSNCGLTELPNPLPPRLEILNCSFNDITRFPNGCVLRELNLTGCTRIKTIPRRAQSTFTSVVLPNGDHADCLRYDMSGLAATATKRLCLSRFAAAKCLESAIAQNAVCPLSGKPIDPFNAAIRLDGTAINLEGLSEIPVQSWRIPGGHVISFFPVPLVDDYDSGDIDIRDMGDYIIVPDLTAPLYHCVPIMTQTVADRIVANAIRKNESCPITFEPLVAGETTVFVCGHVFSTVAVSNTLESCPVCRQKQMPCI